MGKVQGHCKMCARELRLGIGLGQTHVSDNLSFIPPQCQKQLGSYTKKFPEALNNHCWALKVAFCGKPASSCFTKESSAVLYCFVCHVSDTCHALTGFFL